MFRASYGILQEELFNHTTEKWFKGFPCGEYGSTAEHLTSLQYPKKIMQKGKRKKRAIEQPVVHAKKAALFYFVLVMKLPVEPRSISWA